MGSTSTETTNIISSALSTTTTTANSSGSTYAIHDKCLDSPERKGTEQIEMSSTPRSTQSESSVDLYLPKVTNRRTLEVYDKGRSYKFLEIVDIPHRNNST